MRIVRSGFGLLIGIFALEGMAAAADTTAATFHFEEIIVPGSLFTTATGINNSGAIVGYYVDTRGITHGFLLSGSTVTTIDDPNGTATLCKGINSSGAIVGEYTQSNGNNHGFLYQDGTFTDIGIGVISGVSAINDQGVMAGGYLDCSLCAQLGFVYENATYSTLSVQGESFTSTSGINNAGVISVTAGNTSGIYHAYIYSHGNYTKIDARGYADSYATGINNAGDVSMTVFKYQGQKQLQQGAVLHAGHYYFYSYQNNPAILTTGAAINDRREIVGSFEEGLGKGLTIEGFSTTLF